jgi:hypothetical protein
MNRRELDKEILNAIEVLKQNGKKVTAINIQNISEAKLRLYQIYTSKHKNQMEVRVKKQQREKSQSVRSILSSEAEKKKALGARYLIVNKPSVDNKPNKVSIDLNYTIGDTRMVIIRNDADSDDLEEMIEDATFILKKFIERIKREQAKLSK